MIEIKNVKKVYNSSGCKTEALSGIDLKIEDGEFVAIMGKSGSGKSTLLNIIGCIDDVTEGEYILDGVSIEKINSFKLDDVRKNNMSFIFQNYELINQYSVYENIELPFTTMKISKKEQRSRITKTMEMLGIDHLKRKFPKQISGGEQQRVAIARALVADKKYLLADEPTGALDDINSTELMNIIKNIHKEGKTIVLVTHDKDVAAYADRIIYLKDGLVDDKL